MCNKSAISLIVLYLCLDFAHLVHIRGLKSQSVTANTDWDVLIFTQSWPATVCKVWTHLKPKHSCNFPKKKDVWTIHGTWPTKLGTRGPENCNRTWLFDPEQVKPIEDELEQSWTNVEKGTGIYDFWAHEWNKHGTCAAVIEPLNSEFKYFSKTLELLKQYDMNDILEAANIYPSDTNPVTVEQLDNAIVSRLGKKPMIRCVYEDHVQYLMELRICLDKQLNLVGCEGVTKIQPDDTHSYLTNCNVNAGIIYPDQEPPKKQLVQLYKFVKWLQWFTL